MQSWLMRISSLLCEAVHISCHDVINSCNVIKTTVQSAETVSMRRSQNEIFVTVSHGMYLMVLALPVANHARCSYKHFNEGKFAQGFSWEQYQLGSYINIP